MRIAFVTVEYITETTFDGGLANYLHRLACSLLEYGHQPVIVVASDRDDKFDYEGVEIHRVAADNSGFVSFVNRITGRCFANALSWAALAWRLNARVRSIHRRRPVSIVQYASCAGTGLFRLKNVPCVVRISGYLPLSNVAYEIDRTLDVIVSEKLEEIAYYRADGVFAPSEINARAAESATGKPVSVIESPFFLEIEDLDESLFRSKLLGKRYLLFFGSIGLLKGVKLIGDIIGDILKANPDLHFAFAGKDLGYQGGSMMEYVEKKALIWRNRVIYLGKLTHRELYPVIRNAHAVVLPSRIDNYPNVCLEAMAHKRVVVGTYGTSFEQLLRHGDTGFLCKRDDPGDLAKLLQEILELSDQERQKIGEKAYESVLKLRPEKAVKPLLRYYEKIMSGFYGGNVPFTLTSL